MTLEDMTDLINVHDGYMQLVEAFESLGAVILSDSGDDEPNALDKLMLVEDVIERHSKIKLADDDDYLTSRFYQTLINMDLSAEKRAKMLLDG